MHDFKSKLDWSLRQEEILDGMYKSYFPNMIRNELVTDLSLQKAGIDRFITLEGGQIIAVDDKVRNRMFTESSDILLEYVSNDTTMTKGWIEKPLKTDYVAFVFIKDTKLVLLPFIMLQKAWARNKAEWIRLYGTREARNPGYNSLNTPVPIKVLLAAVGREMCHQF